MYSTGTSISEVCDDVAVDVIVVVLVNFVVALVVAIRAVRVGLAVADDVALVVASLIGID